MSKLLGIGTLYYFRDRKDISEDMFEPASKSQWRMMRDLSVGKMGGSYEEYVLRCKNKYLIELRDRERVTFELISVKWNLYELVETQNKIKEIQEDKGFRNWAPYSNKTVSDILELKLKSDDILD
jgi:hypothetical protein|tara:strand:- start:4773 stop:5147 length:375 start_codon:yes stop_codon:yes gene_type:complete